MKFLFVFVFVFVLSVFAQNFRDNEVKISDSLYQKTVEKESKYFSINQTEAVNRYFVCNCENFEISYENGIKILKDYENYENRFKYILKSQKSRESWFFVLGIPLVKTWLWGNVLEKTGETFAEISFVQTKSEINYSDSVKSMAVIEFDKLVLQWNLIKIDEANSRFCLTAAAQPQKPVPQWLIKTALKKIIPKTLRGIKSREKS
ncbi:MAG: hypothetical protein LBH98_04750 [Chitinispirillales bacterium]|nr:hypothetical protein [Chitinispirillales bacterium]